MKLWIAAIEEWTVINKKLTLSIQDIHQIFVSDSGVRPDKECIRLVLSEMRRSSKAVPLNAIRNSNFWSTSATSQPLIDNFIDPKGWLGWGVKKFVYTPATWAVSTFASAHEQPYSDLTDMSITDSMKFVCQKSLKELAQNLFVELLRISKAEKQHCFEWQHLLELVLPIINTIIDATEGKELLESLDILMDYLAVNKKIAMQVDNETKLVKVISTEDMNDEDVSITKKDVAMARLLRAKELLTADADKYHAQAQKSKQDAVISYGKKEVAKAKSLLRSHKRLTACADQKEAQLANVEIMLDQLENTNSNKMILEAYKDGAEALKIANTKLESNVSILDDMYDATAEARQLNDEMNQMLNDISRVGAHDISNTELEAELEQYIPSNENQKTPMKTNAGAQKNLSQSTTNPLDSKAQMDELEAQLNSLEVCQDPIVFGTPLNKSQQRQESTPLKPTLASTIT